ncbi:MBL fold metallo-hydrolase [Miltoncostaea oceani]|uniref:MBL fold metallo-hydrolase n=1 Tax=Miltoncostaea oceani TaxID=2843216 RepID=UPI001C3C2CAB|nr:MBL fold metallo-hydrolase [Miltoncostaea oceani]
MRVHILGVRGSTPAPGPDFTRIGGATSCVAIAEDDDAPTLVLDAGTGIRSLDALLGGAPFRGALALTHLHWDHLTGLPFATSLDHEGSMTEILVPSEGDEPVALLDRMIGPPFFPIGVGDLEGRHAIRELTTGVREIGGLRLECRWLPHGRSKALGMRVDDGRSCVAYLPDHDGRAPGDDALALCREVDVLLHDAHFAPGQEDAAARAGHSTAGQAVALARAAGARRLLLTHHHPDRTDDEVLAIAATSASGDLLVEPARQGMTVRLG